MALDPTKCSANQILDRHCVDSRDNLELYLRQISNIFDASRIIDAPRDKQQVIEYFRLNRLVYQLGLNWEGFFHCGISYDGKNSRQDFREQARIVETYILSKNAQNVLELAYGLGPNSALLAKRNPGVAFEAIDIANKPLRRYTNLPNLHFSFGDFHDLSQFEDDSFDIIFVIEALCYSTDKLRVLREVRRKLRKGGLFIVIDGYMNDRAQPLSSSETLMWQLIFRGCALETFESLDDVEHAMLKEFSIITAEDLSTYVIPSLGRQESKARLYFNHPKMARAINKFLPFAIVKHLPMVLLFATSVRRHIGCYHLHVLENNR